MRIQQLYDTSSSMEDRVPEKRTEDRKELVAPSSHPRQLDGTQQKHTQRLLEGCVCMFVCFHSLTPKLYRLYGYTYLDLSRGCPVEIHNTVSPKSCEGFDW